MRSLQYYFWYMHVLFLVFAMLHATHAVYGSLVRPAHSQCHDRQISHGQMFGNTSGTARNMSCPVTRHRHRMFGLMCRVLVGLEEGEG